MSAAQAHAKFLRYVAPCLGAAAAEELAERVLEADGRTPVDRLLAVR